MELRDYLIIIQKRLWLFLLIFLVFVFASWGLTARSKTLFDASLSTAVNKLPDVEQGKENFYTFDDYYSLQAGSLMAETTAQWLQSPAVVGEIFKEAGVNLPQTDARSLAKTFTVTKLGTFANVVNMIYRNPDKAKGEKILEATRNVIEKKIKEFLPSQEKYLVTFSKEILPVPKNFPLNITVGTVLGIILGLATIFTLEYLRSPKEE